MHSMAEVVKNLHIFGIQLSLVFAITFATQNVSSENCQYWTRKIARYLFYILIIKGSREASVIAYRRILYNTDLSQQLARTARENKRYIFIFTIASSILIYYEQVIFGEEFIWLFMAYLISQYPEIDKPIMINYGVGMACSYFEGYLTKVIPSDGATFGGFQDNVTKFESQEAVRKQQVVFPVKRLFIIITKSIYCPPSLNEFNKTNRPDLPYLEACKDKPTMINYGVGMACSYFEGYLIQVIPSDGAAFVGFQENITIFESNQRVVFPVKRLFIIITKSLYCPPNLKQFNKINRPDLPYLEACRAQKKVLESENTVDFPKSTTDSNEAITHTERRKKAKESLEDVVRDVAGVTNRTYRNSAYKIHRPHGAPLVYLAAECATPLHTLHKVLEKRALYDRLCDVDSQEIVADFCEQLETIIARSPDCRNKCTLIHYDDTNPDENLADLLLQKIKEIEPNFEEIIISRQNLENDVGFDED